MHLFDPRSVLFARHAQHVVLVHFPIALFLTGVAFDFAGRWTGRANLAMVARYNILVAAFAVLPTLATGLLAWQWQLEGRKLKGILLFHLILACASALCVWLVAWIRLRRRASHSLSSYCLTLEVAAAALIAVTAHLGGFLSGVNVPS